MIEVTVAGHTRLNQDIAFVISKLLGRSMTRQLDAKGIEFGSLASYVSAFEEFRQEGTDPYKAQKEAGSSLQHVSVTFLVAGTAEAMFALGGETRLAFLRAENYGQHVFAFASGTLEEWRAAVINGCRDSASVHLRMFATKVLYSFDKMGLSKIFDEYTRAYKTTDGTLLLTSK